MDLITVDKKTYDKLKKNNLEWFKLCKVYNNFLTGIKEGVSVIVVEYILLIDIVIVFNLLINFDCFIEEERKIKEEDIIKILNIIEDNNIDIVNLKEKDIELLKLNLK